MKLLLTLLKITTLFVFVGIMALTIGAYFNLPLPLKPLVVKTGSMEPTIKTGSLVLVMEQGKSTSRINYVNGDIITFKVKNELVSHRIVEIQKKDAFRYFVTKGDANKTPDTSLVAEKDVIGKASLTVHYIGRFVTFVKNPLGFFLLILIPTLLIIISELFAVWEELRKKQSSSGSSLDFAKPFAMFFMAAIFMSSSHAFFSDVATSTNNTFTAGQFVADTLVINEILFKTDCGTPADKQWIELWNGSSSVVNLQDWSLRDQDNNTIQIVNSNTSLNPGQFALLSKSGATWNGDCYGPKLSGVVTVNLGGTININTTSGALKLLDNTLSVVDRVDYGGVGLDPNTNFSIERKILGFDTVSGDLFNSSNFEIRKPSTAGFAIPQTQNVVINEFIIRTTLGNDDWVEIYNKSGGSVDVSSWTLRDTTGTFVTFPASTVMTTGSFMATLDLSNRLNNGCDKVYLFDNLGNLIDGITYCKMTIPANGTSIGRTTDGATTWSTFSTPTKNATNTSPTVSWP